MRVIAGRAGSLKLITPRGQETRPTTDRIKETLFNIIQPYLSDSVFIDLFSGSGGIGIEALSRGAGKAWFVERDGQACSCIRQNLKNTGFETQSVLLRQNVISALPMISDKEADIIFIDPPYHEGWEKKVLAALADQRYVTENTLIIVEALLHTDFSWAEEMGYEITGEKKYRTNRHVFIKKDGHPHTGENVC